MSDTTSIDTMLEADRWVRFALGASPKESIDDAAKRVATAMANGIEQPRGAFETAQVVIARLEGDPWAMMLRARDVAKKHCIARATPSGGADE